jgi:hypothetical protein
MLGQQPADNYQFLLVNNEQELSYDEEENKQRVPMNI